MSIPAAQTSVLDDFSVFPKEDIFEVALEWIDLVVEEMPPGMSTSNIQSVLEDMLALFGGQFEGYHACDTGYHDLSHTLLLIPSFCKLALGLSEKYPGSINPHQVELGVIAVLLHDTGYLREKSDKSGTGGKYTFRHIDRSVDFGKRYLLSLGYGPGDLDCVEQMIRCTGVNVDPAELVYSTAGCRLLGYALGTADLLAQMADPEYDEKLCYLYNEFKEAYDFEGQENLKEMNVMQFKSLEDLIDKTPGFFEHVVMVRFKAMDSAYQLLDDPKTGVNPYMEKIKENIAKIMK
ncbi:MAG: hypothetical protein JRK53_22450 [Deltaproteobacteria bacterium]|nr:hypothetical protein [Deltaproteobacteria bacterium]